MDQQEDTGTAPEIKNTDLSLDSSDDEGIEELSEPGAPLPASDTNVDTDEAPQSS